MWNLTLKSHANCHKAREGEKSCACVSFDIYRGFPPSGWFRKLQITVDLEPGGDFQNVCGYKTYSLGSPVRIGRMKLPSWVDLCERTCGRNRCQSACATCDSQVRAVRWNSSGQTQADVSGYWKWDKNWSNITIIDRILHGVMLRYVGKYFSTMIK